MPHFIFAYHGGKMPDTPEEGAALMKRWEDWLGGMGEACINPGNPVGMSKTVSASGVEDNGGSNPLSGFSIIEAADIDGAIGLTNGCPHLEEGTIEVAELMEM